MSSDSTVRSVERALAILEHFSYEDHSLTLSQISQAVGLPTTTTLRLLQTMGKGDFIARDSSTGFYSLGWKIAKLGNIAFANLDICAAGYPYLEQLRATYNESFGLYIMRGAERICVARIDSTRSLRHCVTIGSVRPLDCGASGHVLMAYSDNDCVQKLLKHSKFCTPEMLSKVRAQGYSASYGEFADSVTSIAAPVFSCTGEIAAALFVTGPSARINEDMVFQYAQALKDYAKRISMQLGFIP